jgi:Domain of unknown function (DUF3883)
VVGRLPPTARFQRITQFLFILHPSLPSRHIEVKGCVKGATAVTVSKNEIFESWNQGAKYHLAIVLVGDDDASDGPHYVSHPFKVGPPWGASSVNYDFKALLALSKKL